MENEPTQVDANARAMQLWIMKVLAVSVTAGFFAVLFTLLFIEMPQASHDVMLMLLGALVPSWGQIIGYFFGSSASSANKDNKPKETQP